MILATLTVDAEILDRSWGADTVIDQEDTPMNHTLINIINTAQTTTALVLGGHQSMRMNATRRRRGATFIEYALLAGVAVAVTFLLRKQLLALVDNVVTGISDGFNNNKKE